MYETGYKKPNPTKLSVNTLGVLREQSGSGAQSTCFFCQFFNGFLLMLFLRDDYGPIGMI